MIIRGFCERITGGSIVLLQNYTCRLYRSTDGRTEEDDINVYTLRSHEHGPLIHEQMYASLYAAMPCCLVERQKFPVETPHNKACGLSPVTVTISIRKHDIQIFIFWHEKADISADHQNSATNQSQ